jgi:hypothetical protein
VWADMVVWGVGCHRESFCANVFVEVLGEGIWVRSEVTGRPFSWSDSVVARSVGGEFVRDRDEAGCRW